MSRKRTSELAEGLLELEPGLVIAQKYKLERLLKSGGMGAVWVATHLGLETTVAIKFMGGRLFDNPMTVEGEDGEKSNPLALTRVRFEREAKAAARIRSTNVVQMLDHGIDQGTPYIVMEYLRGEDLEARLKRVSRMTIGELLPIVNAIGRALQLAHAEELVHRDLKPENIFLAKEGDEEIPKILDFGVAKAKTAPAEQTVESSGLVNQTVDGATVQGTMVGTPQYMSPEQIQVGRHVDHRSDLWGFAVLIFRALTGKLPFPSVRMLKLAMQICQDPIPTATSVAPDLPPNIDAFFEKALSRDPDKRFQSARELVAAFQDFAAGGALAPSTSTISIAANLELPDKPKKGNRSLPFVLAGMAFALIVGGGLFVWLRSSSREHAPDAVSQTPPVANSALTGPTVPVAASSAPESTAVPESTASVSASATASAPVASASTSGPRPLSTATSKTKKGRNVGY